MNLPKVYNLENDNYYSAVNQFVIETSNLKVFQSYETRVAYIRDGKVTILADVLGECCTGTPSSKTTRKHLYIFLRDHAHMNIHSIKDLNAYVKAGRIKVRRSF